VVADERQLSPPVGVPSGEHVAAHVAVDRRCLELVGDRVTGGRLVVVARDLDEPFGEFRQCHVLSWAGRLLVCGVAGSVTGPDETAGDDTHCRRRSPSFSVNEPHELV
jgi:hypothetical protein